MLDEFYESPTRPSNAVMANLEMCIKYTLQDIGWIGVESEEHILDWMHETLQKLLIITSNT